MFRAMNLIRLNYQSSEITRRQQVDMMFKRYFHSTALHYTSSNAHTPIEVARISSERAYRDLQKRTSFCASQTLKLNQKSNERRRTEIFEKDALFGKPQD